MADEKQILGGPNWLLGLDKLTSQTVDISKRLGGLMNDLRLQTEFHKEVV
jgi:hypothetical protein